MKKNFKRANSSLNIRQLKYQLNKSNIKSKLLMINKNPKSRKIYNNTLFPQRNVQTFQHIIDNINNYTVEMHWQLEIISMYKDTLSDFLAKTEEYSREYFNSNYTYCNRLLTEIESIYGNSIWLIENKINLFNVTDKETSEGYYETLENSELNSYYKFLNWILHSKSDELVSPARFQIELHRMVHNWPWVKKYNLSDFLLFHFSMGEENIDLNSLLNVLENFSLIDRYYTLLKITENLIDSDNKKVDDALLNRSYDILYSIYPNNLSPYYRILKNDNTTNEENAKLILALDAYSQGNYDASIAICEEIMQILPYEIGVYEIYTKSLLVKDINFLEESNGLFYIKIINLLLEIYSNSEKSAEKIGELLKICISHNSNKWAWKLLSLITNQKYGINIFKSVPTFKKGFKYSSFLKPQILSSLFKESHYQDKYIELNFYPESITYKIHKAYSELDLNQIESLDIEENRKLRFLGNIYLLKKDYQEALKSFNKISSGSFIYQPEIIKGKINSYIGLENYEVALNLLVDSYLEEYEVIRDIDLLFMYESLLEEEYSYSNINILIFIELLTRYNEEHHLEIRKHNFLEDFLDENDLNLISEMNFNIEMYQKYPKEKLIFVLKEYCTIENMSQYHYFETYEQVEEERIKICRILTQIDPENKNIYSEEIRDLTEKSQIRVHTAALEKSKIYVDTEGIKKQALSLIDDNFNRITEYFSSSKTKGLPVEWSYFGSENEKVENTFKRNSYSEIYNEMIFNLRDTFIFSKQYGLNVYLSLGIRHGTILAQFRKLFEKDYFLTLFDSYENKYKINHYWLEKLNVNQSNKNLVISAFNSFNKNIDDLLNLLKDAKLQISTDPNDTVALFNYFIPQMELMMLYTEHVFTDNLTIETFIDQIIEMLWEYTERNLTVVREYLNNHFKLNLLETLNSFITEIEDINKKTGMQLNLQEFNNKIIDLRTEIEYQIKYVSNWFTKENIVDIDNFTLELPVNIPLEYIKSSNFNISIDSTVEIDTNNLKVQGKYLKWFNELFYVIFDNIIKRSGFHNSFEFDLEIRYEDSFLKMECINPINLDAQEILNRREILKDKLSEIKYITTHEESNIIARASEEGGSGLYKIVKVLRYDIKTPTFSLDFGIDDDQNYFIYISLDTRGIIFEDINS